MNEPVFHSAGKFLYAPEINLAKLFQNIIKT